MTAYDNTHAPRLRQLLARREAELHQLLDLSFAEPPLGADTRDQMDFKDMAGAESIATVDEAHAAQAYQELTRLRQARRRFQDGTYGLCLDCGEAIALRRLEAVPDAAYCPSCQRIHERRRHQACAC